jgi:Methyltransferase FkbM domain
MPNLIKNIRLNSFGIAGKFVTDMTSSDDLHQLIKNLHPVETNKQLLRFGATNDGGYLIPDDLEGISSCFSPGVAEVSDFENDCAKRGMNVFLADYSVENAARDNSRFHFTKKYIGVTTNDKFMTLDDWVNQHSGYSGQELMLQIDIEGFEYEVFLAASHCLMSKFRIIVAEFHRLDQWWSKPFFNIASRTFDKILETHHCVHLHPNNVRGSVRRAGIEIPINMEFTFLRKDRAETVSLRSQFPHPLDTDNVSTQRHLPLPRCWYYNNANSQS